MTDICTDDSRAMEYLEMENNDLRQQVEEVELQNIWLQESADLANQERQVMSENLSRERATFKEEATKMNRQITEKCVSLSNLVDEYQKILDMYVAHTQVKLCTNKLEELRKQGGYL